jgi:hypothetical protein
MSLPLLPRGAIGSLSVGSGQNSSGCGLLLPSLGFNLTAEDSSSICKLATLIQERARDFFW